MTTKQVDREATQSLIENINAAERKLRMMKQYINPEVGTVNDMQLVAGLFHGTDDCMKTINNLLVKFL